MIDLSQITPIGYQLNNPANLRYYPASFLENCPGYEPSTIVNILEPELVDFNSLADGYFALMCKLNWLYNFLRQTKMIDICSYINLRGLIPNKEYSRFILNTIQWKGSKELPRPDITSMWVDIMIAISFLENGTSMSDIKLRPHAETAYERFLQSEA